MGELGQLASLFGGGGTSLSPSSSTAQSTPFYNEAGIYFDSPGSGAISGNASSATATDPSRANAGGIAPQPSSALVNPGVSASTGDSLIYIVLGMIVAGGLGFYFIFKK